MKRKLLILKLFVLTVLGKSHSKADALRKSGLFGTYGNGGYWHPNWVPSYPELICIGNNVAVAADVRLYEHDEVNRLWNGDPDYCGEKIPYHKDGITIEDNVVLGARSMIMPGITVGHHAVVAAGSVVTKDVQPYTIVGGESSQGNRKC